MKEIRYITSNASSKPKLLPGQICYGQKTLKNGILYLIYDTTETTNKHMKTSQFIISKELFEHIQEEDAFLIDAIGYAVLNNDEEAIWEVVDTALDDVFENEDDYQKEMIRLSDQAFSTYEKVMPILKHLFQIKYPNLSSLTVSLEEVIIRKNYVIFVVSTDD